MTSIGKLSQNVDSNVIEFYSDKAYNKHSLYVKGQFLSYRFTSYLSLIAM